MLWDKVHHLAARFVIIMRQLKKKKAIVNNNNDNMSGPCVYQLVLIFSASYRPKLSVLSLLRNTFYFYLTLTFPHCACLSSTYAYEPWDGLSSRSVLSSYSQIYNRNKETQAEVSGNLMKNACFCHQVSTISHKYNYTM